MQQADLGVLERDDRDSDGLNYSLVLWIPEQQITQGSTVAGEGGKAESHVSEGNPYFSSISRFCTRSKQTEDSGQN
jgi:hypothetical protein